MPFVSDAQRKHFFANGGGGGGGVSSFPDFDSAFRDMNRELAFPADGPAAGSGNNPMPTMSAEESAAWRKGMGVKGY